MRAVVIAQHRGRLEERWDEVVGHDRAPLSVDLCRISLLNESLDQEQALFLRLTDDTYQRISLRRDGAHFRKAR